MPLRDYVKGRENKIIIGGGSAVGLAIVAATATIFNTWVRPAYLVPNPDGERLWEVTDHGAIGVGTGANAFGALGDCLKSGGGSGEMMSFGACASFGTGNVLAIGDSRYVNVSGDTMTGALTINVTGGAQNTVGLEVINSISGAVLHAEKGMTNSGSLVNEGTGLFNGVLSMNSLLSFIGYSASPQITATDTTTGINFDGPAIVSIHNGGIETITFTSTNRVGIGTTAPSEKLEVSGTISGSVIYGKNSLRSSGSLIWEGAASGATLVISGQFSGAGLTDCDLATQALGWDAGANRFTCGTDSDTTYTAGEGLSLNGTSFSRIAAMTGTSLTIHGTISGALITQNGAGNNYFRGNVGIGTTSPTSILHMSGGNVMIEKQITGQNVTLSLKPHNSPGTPNTSEYQLTSGTIGQFQIFNARTSTYAFFVDPSGNFGIGTNNPSQTLHILTPNGSPGMLFESSAVGNPVYVGLKAKTDPGTPAAREWRLQSQTDGSFRIFDNVAARARLLVDTLGLTGIGTNTPGSRLSVSGSVVIGNNIGTSVAKAQLDVKGTISGSALTVSGLGGAAVNHGLCMKSVGVVGYCSTALDASGACTCN